MQGRSREQPGFGETQLPAGEAVSHPTERSVSREKARCVGLRRKIRGISREKNTFFARDTEKLGDFFSVIPEVEAAIVRKLDLQVTSRLRDDALPQVEPGGRPEVAGESPGSRRGNHGTNADVVRW